MLLLTQRVVINVARYQKGDLVRIFSRSMMKRTGFRAGVVVTLLIGMVAFADVSIVAASQGKSAVRQSTAALSAQRFVAAAEREGYTTRSGYRVTVAPNAYSVSWSPSATVPDPCLGEKVYSIFYATHAFPNPFFTPMMKGAIAGARDNCMTVTWTESPSVYSIPNTIVRMDAGIAERPDFLVVAMCDPAAETPAVKAADAAGIEVINVNCDDIRPVLQQPTYLSYVGITSEITTGTMAAEAILAVNPHPTFAAVGDNEPGDPELTNRVDGFVNTMKSAGVKTGEFSDPTPNTSEDIEAYILAHPTLDALYCLGNGPGGSAAAIPVIQHLGDVKKILMVTTDYDITDLDAIKSGHEVAAISQAQYLQGYLPNSIARGFEESGAAPSFVQTGPTIIDSTNVDQWLKLYSEGKA